MKAKLLPELRIGDLVIEKPIIQGGMGVGISLSGLAAAVANAGGAGIIAGAGIGMLENGFEKDFKNANRKALRKHIRKARKLTNGIIGINLMVALSDFESLVKVAVEEKVDLILIGAGLPLRNLHCLIPDSSSQNKPKVIPIVSSSRAVKIIFQYWQKNYQHVPDAVVIEGPLAGGHLGYNQEQIEQQDSKLHKILPEVISVLKPFENKFKKNIPVIVAGGIFDGNDIFQYIKAGAQGVQMATRFVATEECDAAQSFKQMFLECKREDLVLIDSPVGMPGRAIGNQFLTEVAKGARKPFKCFWKCLKTCHFKEAPYCIASALTAAQKGDFKNGFAFAGANAYRVNEIVPVKKLVNRLLAEYQQALIAASCTDKLE